MKDDKMVVVPVSKQKCLNMSRKHNSWAYYCDECLDEIRREERTNFFKKLRKIMKTRFNMKEKYIEKLLNLLS